MALHVFILCYHCIPIWVIGWCIMNSIQLMTGKVLHNSSPERVSQDVYCRSDAISILKVSKFEYNYVTLEQILRRAGKPIRYSVNKLGTKQHKLFTLDRFVQPSRKLQHLRLFTSAERFCSHYMQMKLHENLSDTKCTSFNIRAAQRNSDTEIMPEQAFYVWTCRRPIRYAWFTCRQKKRIRYIVNGDKFKMAGANGMHWWRLAKNVQYTVDFWITDQGFHLNTYKIKVCKWKPWFVTKKLTVYCTFLASIHKGHLLPPFWIWPPSWKWTWRWTFPTWTHDTLTYSNGLCGVNSRWRPWSPHSQKSFSLISFTCYQE